MGLDKVLYATVLQLGIKHSCVFFLELDLNHYIMMTLREEFVTKIQAALFSIVNTSAIFGENLSAYE